MDAKSIISSSSTLTSSSSLCPSFKPSNLNSRKLLVLPVNANPRIRYRFGVNQTSFSFWRGSFVTHRAFCDALTVEGIQPSRPSIIPNFISMPIINDTTHEHQTSLVSIFNHLDIKTPSGTMFSGDPSASLLGGATMSNCFSSSFSPLQINANSLASPAFMSVQKPAQIGEYANLMSFPVAGITLPTLSAMQTQNDHYRTTLAAEIFHKDRSCQKGTSVRSVFQ